MDTRAVVGLNLARIRRERGLTQEQLEEGSGVSQQYLSALETGVRNPSILILMRIAGALGVSVFALLAGLDGVPAPREAKKAGPRRTAASRRD